MSMQVARSENRVGSLRLRRWACAIVGVAALLLGAGMSAGSSDVGPTGGELRIVGEDADSPGACPLEHTEVEADVVGFIGRVQVRQTFHNPLDHKIEAVYVFPLPQDAAVDEMTMLVGDRRIVAQIKPREEARKIFQAARAAGHVAGLLDQQRPNVFTQSVTNIEPGARVVIEISYVETLAYDDGVFEFVFPMVVGPRYMPGRPTGKQGTGWAPDTSEVPDASRISPPVAPPGSRAGHDIDLTVHLDAGAELVELESVLHDVVITREGGGRATIALDRRDEIPNRDFILRYATATDSIGDAFLLHADERGKFFTLVLQPPKRVRPEQAVPKEMIFVIDRSGSMTGFPIETAKETMRLAIEQMNPNDTFNLLSFAGGTGKCFPKPVPNTAANRAVALRYLADLHGSGGTEMMPAILEALGGAPDPERLRIVAFMTDGFIGNDFAIIDAVQKHAGTARVFSFGIGNSVNRFLLDGMAHHGRGQVEYVTLDGDRAGAAERFHERIHSPVLTDITIDWGDIPVDDVYPTHVPDLFSQRPILVHGRLRGDAEGTIVLRGTTVAGPFEREIAVSTSGAGSHEGLASLWARAKIDHLMMLDLAALQSGSFPDDLRGEITRLGIEHRLMTQFTSFVAVEEMTVTTGGEPKVIAVPVDVPEGVDYEGVFGGAEKGAAQVAGQGSVSYFAAPAAEPAARAPAFLSREGLVGREAKLADRRLAPTAPDKLDSALRELVRRVEREPENGSFTAGETKVENYRTEVILYLRDLSAESLESLERLGFEKSGEIAARSVVSGTIDVRKLEALAKLEDVVRVVRAGAFAAENAWGPSSVWRTFTAPPAPPR